MLEVKGKKISLHAEKKARDIVDQIIEAINKIEKHLGLPLTEFTGGERNGSRKINQIHQGRWPHIS